MNKSVNDVVKKINSLIQKQSWLDFDVFEYKQDELSLIGSISPSDPYYIKIIFKSVFFISLPMAWKTDTSKEVFQIVENDEAQKINKKFHIEQGHYLFKFVPEDYEEDFGCIIAAKEIDFVIQDAI